MTPKLIISLSCLLCMLGLYFKVSTAIKVSPQFGLQTFTKHQIRLLNDQLSIDNANNQKSKEQNDHPPQTNTLTESKNESQPLKADNQTQQQPPIQNAAVNITQILNLALFTDTMALFSDYSGLYKGTWTISPKEDPKKMSPLFDKHSGKTQFEFQFNQEPDVYDQYGYASGGGSFYSGDFRDQEVDIEFRLSPRFEYHVDIDQGTFMMQNVTVLLQQKSEFKILNITQCHFDIRVTANFDQLYKSKSQASTMSQAENEYEAPTLSVQELKLIMTMPHNTTHQCFVDEIHVNLKAQNLEELMEKILNYSFLVTACCMGFVYALIGQMKKATENITVAQTLSVPMLGYSIIWNFVYFSMYFEIATSRSVKFYQQLSQYFHYFSLPAFWYFMICFFFQFRLLVISWQAQSLELFRTVTSIILISLGSCCLKESIHFFCILFYIFSGMVFFNDILLFIFSGSVWIPQIFRSYQKRSKFGPESYFTYFLTAVHSFFPFYLKACPFNMFDRKPNYTFAMLYLGYFMIQLWIMKQQRQRNPRFFVPYAWRKNPNAYNYIYRVPQTQQVSDIERQEINQDEDCVICMNPIVFEVDSANDGNVSLQHASNGQAKKAKTYMKTPCNHKYHVPCLKKWMEIRLECPSCRQQIPPIEEDD